MPVLAAEPALFPETLFDGPPAEGSRWLVLHTRPRQEKAVARELTAARLPFFLPLVAKRLNMRGRRMTSFVPLFPGYVFRLAGREEPPLARLAPRLAHRLDVPDQSRLWDDLRQIRQLIHSGLPITREDRLGPGAQVTICQGPLAGLRGKVVRTASDYRFVVRVDFIQQGACVLLDGDCLSEIC